MNRFFRAIALVLLVCLAVPALAADPYKVDQTHSNINFSIRHIFSQVSGRFTKFSGTITFDGQDDGVRPPAAPEAHAHRFTGPREHRVVAGVGHNMPQEAPAQFAQAGFEGGAPSLLGLQLDRQFGQAGRGHAEVFPDLHLVADLGAEGERGRVVGLAGRRDRRAASSWPAVAARCAS